MEDKKQKRIPRYLRPIRSSSNLLTKQKKATNNVSDLIDLDEFDRMEQINEEKHRLIQAKKIRDMIQQTYYKKIKSKEKAEREALKIQQMRKKRDSERKLKAKLKREKTLREKQRREQELRREEMEEKEKNAEREAILNEKLENARIKKEEERQALAERAIRENAKRKQMEQQRREKFIEIEKEKQRIALINQEKAILKQQRIAEIKEQKLNESKLKMQKKREKQRVKVQKMKEMVVEELKLKRIKSLSNLQTAQKRRRDLKIEREIQLNHRRIIAEEKRLKVLEKKHLLMQTECNQKRSTVEMKEKIIKERLTELQEKQRAKSRKIRKEIDEKQKQAIDKVKSVEEQESDYVHTLQNKLHRKYAKINAFKKKKHDLYKKAIEKRIYYDLRKEKFSSIVNELLRTSNSIERLQRMGLNISDPNHINVQEIAQILSENDSYTPRAQPLKHSKSAKKLKPKKKCIIRSQSNLLQNRNTSSMSFTLPSQKPSQKPTMQRTLHVAGENGNSIKYCLAPTPAFPVTQTRKISFSMSM